MAHAPIVWLDLETTGLDSRSSHVVEVAIVVTDASLRERGAWDGYVFQPAEVLAASDAWCLEQHEASGLYELVRTQGRPAPEVEADALAFLRRHVEKREAWLAGANPAFDAAFLAEHLPSIPAWLHYRMLDIHSVARAHKLWRPEVYASAPRRQKPHRALSDLRETIEQMRHYRQAMRGAQVPVKRALLPVA